MGTQNGSILPEASVWQNVFTIKDHQETFFWGGGVLYKYLYFNCGYMTVDICQNS